MTIVHQRPVLFDEVDAAGLVFFGHFLRYAHEAMELFFEDGYADIIMRRRIGFPAVHLETDFHAPLRFGDTVRVDATVKKLGTTSVTFRYVLSRGRDQAKVAEILHVVVASNLDTVTKIALPDDVRGWLAKHIEG